jgi:superfamily II DNA/RNA helicase
VKSNALRLGEVDCLVLDEADRMLDMGFIHDIRKIVAKLPAARQTLMFSATMPRAIADLAAQMLREPVKVAVAPVASTA